SRETQVQGELKKAVKGLSKFLHKHVVSSAADEWASVLKSESRVVLSELLGRLAFLLELRERDLTSPVFPDGCARFTRPSGRVDLSSIKSDFDLQYQLNICLRRFAAAAPDGFLRCCLTQINDR